MKRYLLGLVTLLLSVMLVFGCGSTSDNTDTPTRPTKIYLFRSSTGTKGNLAGRVGADMLVNASVYKPTGNYTVHAFISVSSSDCIKNMPANYGFPDDIPIVSAASGNFKIADNWADLLDGSIDIKLADTSGAGVLPDLKSSIWWSGSNADGTVSVNCSGWMDNSGATNGVVGYGEATDERWIADWQSTGDNFFYILGIAY